MEALRVELREVTKRFGPRTAVDGVSLSAEPGRVLAVLGASGAGKSTLLRVAALLIPPEEGTVLLDGEPAAPGAARQHRIAMVGQKPAVFRTSVFENVVFGLRARSAPETELAWRGKEAMERLGIAHLAQSPARRLSGGEQQRVALARALVLRPDVLLLDEFTANLDPVNALEAEREVRRVADAGVTVIAAIHDLATARRMADDVIVLAQGTLREVGSARAFFAGPASEEGRALLAAAMLSPEKPAPSRATVK